MADEHTPTRYLRVRQVLDRVPICRTTLWRWSSEGHFPKPHQLSENVTAWRESDVEAWLRSRGEP
jgi:prophage regulatory protein